MKRTILLLLKWFRLQGFFFVEQDKEKADSTGDGTTSKFCLVVRNR